jgi:hypothetical protein
MAIELTQELQDQICNAVIQEFSVRAAYKKKLIPISDHSVWNLAHKNPEFSKKLEEARKIGVQRYIDETLEIANNSEGDVDGETRDGRPKISWECVNRSKIRIDTIFRVIALIDPERYSEAFYKPKDRRIKLGKAKSNSVSDRIEVIYNELEKGKITPEEAMRISNVLQVQVNVVETKKVMDELKKLEEKLNASVFAGNTT